jgi:hypothetical protein
MKFGPSVSMGVPLAIRDISEAVIERINALPARG